ncbi:MAG: alanine--tRNA ligase [Clostridia bacterium]|nr:alanine--tRNA ligase [Clostridia bacterium]
MEKLGLNEIRKKFIEFYESKGHYAAKSASLIPKNDKSLLIINSGMAPLKRYFSGQDTPPSKRMTTCQKCVRTGDIENVGKTSRHGTFFEMLGSFSFGDYFKEESITWGWELITKVFGMDPERIWATVYLDDEQAVSIWKKIGLPEERIVRLGKEDNFWEIGLGPCGPDSEIFYDRGEEYGCGKPDCRPGCDCDRFVEFWNHVFTQFSREEDGSYSDLAHPNIDTGMGLERMACLMQGVDSIFDIDTIRYILDGVLELSGVRYEEADTASTDISVRIITDHLRSMVFMIADGITPSNEGRGYVLRRLIRRAVRHGKLIGIEGAFLSGLVDRVVKVSGEAYPEIVERQELIKRVIDAEEERFEQTLGQGMEIISGYLNDLAAEGATCLDGERAFKLYDTYGFPIEMTEEILAEKGYTIDQEGFRERMLQQKKMAQAGRKVDDPNAGWKDKEELPPVAETCFRGYELLSAPAKVLAVRAASGSEDVITAGEEGKVYLDQTPFYAESGGQIYDTGFMYTDALDATVLEVKKQKGIFAHQVRVQAGSIAVGDTVQTCVLPERRHLIARNHTATHLLQKALREVLGSHVEQAGSLVNEKTLRFDFSHYEAMTSEQLQQVEEIVNHKIRAFLPVTVREMPVAEAEKLGAMALFGEKYGDIVRVVSAGDWSIELCGGTHVQNTGEIGAFRILSETGVAAGTRRIEAVTADGLHELTVRDDALLKELCGLLKCRPDTLLSRAGQLLEEQKAAQKELERIRKEALGGSVAGLLAEAKEINGIKLITKEFADTAVDELRQLSDNVKAEASGVAMVFAAVNDGKVVLLVSLTDDVVEKGFHAGKMIKEIASACGGGGGGKANMAQAGGKDPGRIPAAFSVAERLLG